MKIVKAIAHRVLLLLLAVPVCGTAAESPIGREAARSIPIADAHFHFFRWMDLQELVKLMDKHGIRWAGGGHSDSVEGPERAAEVAAVLGPRFIRETGFRQWRDLLREREKDPSALEDANHPAFKRALESMETDFKEKGARVIGEIHVNAITTGPSLLTRHKVRANAPTLHAMLALASKYKRPMNIHAQWDSDTVREIDSLVQAHPEARLIISHCGSFATASDMRQLFTKHRTVGCDLSHRGQVQLKGKAQARAIFDESRIFGGWRELIEEFPDRFIVGIDDVQTWDQYEHIANSIRYGLLANLIRETAEKVAYRNAVAWFGLE